MRKKKKVRKLRRSRKSKKARKFPSRIALDIGRIFQQYKEDIYSVMFSIFSGSAAQSTVSPVPVSMTIENPGIKLLDDGFEPCECNACGIKFDIFAARCPSCFDRLVEKMEAAENKAKYWESKINYLRAHQGYDRRKMLMETINGTYKGENGRVYATK